MKMIITNMLLLIALWCNAQFTPIPERWHVTNQYSDDNIHYQTKIDTIKGDTAHFLRNSRRYMEVSKEGIILVDGHTLGGMSSECGCNAKPHGYWIERYRNGNLKMQGKYQCYKKVGTWISYYENGQLQKIEHYKSPYLKTFVSQEYNLKTDILLEGPYLEYYSNGQLKTDGNYEIIEEFSPLDTIFALNYETYEVAPFVKQGEFWIPKSIKSGHWNHYSETGELLEHQYYDIKIWVDKNIRPLKTRYWDIVKEIANEKE